MLRLEGGAAARQDAFFKASFARELLFGRIEAVKELYCFRRSAPGCSWIYGEVVPDRFRLPEQQFYQVGHPDRHRNARSCAGKSMATAANSSATCNRTQQKLGRPNSLRPVAT
jgi:hypothetical protein